MQKTNKGKHIPGSWKNKIVNSDLQEERDKRDFDGKLGDGVKVLLDGATFKRLGEAADFVSGDPVLRNTHKFYDMTKEEMWEHHMAKYNRAFSLDKEKWFKKHECNDVIWGYAALGQNPCVLNYTMFSLAIVNMCTDEQRKKWETACRNASIMGTYAQTEIGHGSNVAGIETTATFDKSTDEFVIHTPSPTATKWWPGDLGNFSSHAMVFCRLKIEG